MPEAPRRYELTVRVSTPGQTDAVLHREIVTEKQSTDGALSELWSSVSDAEKAKMCPVNDAR
jgi:hypothetical protein